MYVYIYIIYIFICTSYHIILHIYIFRVNPRFSAHASTSIYVNISLPLRAPPLSLPHTTTPVAAHTGTKHATTSNSE